MRFLYSQLVRMVVPLKLARLVWQSRRHPACRRRLWQRLGFDLPSRPDRPVSPVWVHLPSEEDAMAMAPLLERLLSRYPRIPLLVTSTGPADAARVARQFGDRIDHCWVPMDAPGAVARVLTHFEPRMLVLGSLEPRPNLVHQASTKGLPIYLLNATLSAGAARRYARFPGLHRPMMAKLDVVAAQTRDDAQRLQSVGVSPGALQVVGSAAYDVDLSSLMVACSSVRSQLGPALIERRVFVAMSLHSGEEEPVLHAYRRLQDSVPGALLILSTWRRERSAALVREDALDGLVWQLRSANELLADSTQVLLWDRPDDVGALPGLAEAVIVGGSLVHAGGHDPLVAAGWGVPILVGPHTAHHAVAYRQLLNVGAAQEVTSDATLYRKLVALANDPDAARRRGLAGRRVVDSHRGAIEQQFALLGAYLD